MELQIKKSIALPRGLAARAEVAARDELRSFSGYIQKVLADQLDWRPGAEVGGKQKGGARKW